MGLFQPKWDNEDIDVAISNVEKIKMNPALIKIVRSKKAAKQVKLAALRKITDQPFLIEYLQAETPQDPAIIETTISSMREDSLLAYLEADKKVSEEKIRIILPRITDQLWLAKYYCKASVSKKVLEKTASCITEPVALRYAYDHRNSTMIEQQILKYGGILSEDELIKIYRYSLDDSIREKSLEKIWNQYFLEEIVLQPPQVHRRDVRSVAAGNILEQERIKKLWNKRRQIQEKCRSRTDLYIILRALFKHADADTLNEIFSTVSETTEYCAVAGYMPNYAEIEKMLHVCGFLHDTFFIRIDEKEKWLQAACALIEVAERDPQKLLPIWDELKYRIEHTVISIPHLIDTGEGMTIESFSKIPLGVMFPDKPVPFV